MKAARKKPEPASVLDPMQLNADLTKFKIFAHASTKVTKNKFGRLRNLAEKDPKKGKEKIENFIRYTVVFRYSIIASLMLRRFQEAIQDILEDKNKIGTGNYDLLSYPAMQYAGVKGKNILGCTRESIIENLEAMYHELEAKFEKGLFNPDAPSEHIESLKNKRLQTKDKFLNALETAKAELENIDKQINPIDMAVVSLTGGIPAYPEKIRELMEIYEKIEPQEGNPEATSD